MCSISLFLIFYFFISLTEHCLTLNFLRTQPTNHIFEIWLKRACHRSSKVAYPFVLHCTQLLPHYFYQFHPLPKKKAEALVGWAFLSAFLQVFFDRIASCEVLVRSTIMYEGGICICSTSKILNNYPFTCCQKSLLENITWSHSVDCRY